ncbi:methyltransferase domain-containing protein [Micromonospora sp. NPDC049366]|uniref:methyltransferase domain-containing protein n=1 Tax=Micromonospora sp. NPDC049366 TaxID=3364271 RepID=UPI00379559F4
MSRADQRRPTETVGEEYTRRLQRLGGARWKRALDVQAPYRWNLRRLHLGRTLDVGSGLGRNLANLDGNGVGVDHNPTSVAHTRAAGFEAYTIDEFHRSPHARPDAFDSLLAAHLLEHLPADEANDVIASYLPYVRSGGTAVFITPQERGYRSDASHVRFVGFPEAAETCRALGLTVLRQYSFPFPRALGRVFTYNEFVTVARLP